MNLDQGETEQDPLQEYISTTVEKTVARIAVFLVERMRSWEQIRFKSTTVRHSRGRAKNWRTEAHGSGESSGTSRGVWKGLKVERSRILCHRVRGSVVSPALTRRIRACIYPSSKLPLKQATARSPAQGATAAIRPISTTLLNPSSLNPARMTAELCWKCRNSLTSCRRLANPCA